MVNFQNRCGSMKSRPNGRKSIAGVMHWWQAGWEFLRNDSDAPERGGDHRSRIPIVGPALQCRHLFFRAILTPVPFISILRWPICPGTPLLAPGTPPCDILLTHLPFWRDLIQPIEIIGYEKLAEAALTLGVTRAAQHGPNTKMEKTMNNSTRTTLMMIRLLAHSQWDAMTAKTV